MNIDCEKQYSNLCKADEAHQLALAAANEAAARMAETLGLPNPLDAFGDFNSHEAANKFKGVAYECVLAELSRRREISQEIRLLLKHKTHDPGNPPPTTENLAAFAEYAKSMEAKTKWTHARPAKS